MFNEWNYLNDARTDCLTKVQGYPSTYVFAGARATVTFSGRYGGFPFSQYFKNQIGEITNAVAAKGYQGVSVTVDNAIVGDGRGTITFSIPIDQSSSDDVKGNISAALAGIGINVSSINVAISNPTFDQICGAGGSGSPSTGTGSVSQGSPGGTVGSFMDNLASGIGVSTPIAIAGIAIFAYLMLKR